MHKKGSYDFVITLVPAFLVLVLILTIFGIVFFVMGGSERIDTSIEAYEIPDSTLKSLLKLQTSTGETLQMSLVSAYTDYRVLDGVNQCLEQTDSVDKCNQVLGSTKIKFFTDEFSTMTTKYLNSEEWVLEVHSYKSSAPMQFFLESKLGLRKSMREGIRSSIPRFKTASSSRIIPLPNDKGVLEVQLLKNE